MFKYKDEKILTARELSDKIKVDLTFLHQNNIDKDIEISNLYKAKEMIDKKIKDFELKKANERNKIYSLDISQEYLSEFKSDHITIVSEGFYKEGIFYDTVKKRQHNSSEQMVYLQVKYPEYGAHIEYLIKNKIDDIIILAKPTIRVSGHERYIVGIGKGFYIARTKSGKIYKHISDTRFSVVNESNAKECLNATIDDPKIREKIFKLTFLGD